MVESANLEAVFLEVCHFASTTVWRGVILPGTEKCHGHSTRQGHRGAPGQGVDIRMKDVTVRGQSIRSGLLGPGKMEKCVKSGCNRGLYIVGEEAEPAGPWTQDRWTW